MCVCVGGVCSSCVYSHTRTHTHTHTHTYTHAPCWRFIIILRRNLAKYFKMIKSFEMSSLRSLVLSSNNSTLHKLSLTHSVQSRHRTNTNTRQIGVKHTITLLKPTPSTSLGFGVTSRDVMTDNQNIPFYVKNITPGTPAFNDGRLKMGERLLQVCECGVCVCGVSVGVGCGGAILITIVCLGI